MVILVEKLWDLFRCSFEVREDGFIGCILRGSGREK